jgi:hypothetical protein
MAKNYYFLLIFLVLSGCSYNGSEKIKKETKIAAVDYNISEESRALTTGIVDILNAQPDKDQYSMLAFDFAKKDQSIEGMPSPSKRYNVEKLLSENIELKTAAQNEANARFLLVSKLVEEKKELQDELNIIKEKLIAKGQEKEREDNKNIIKKVWAWAISTLGIGGIIALCVFFPFLIPIFGSILSFIVGKIPSLINFVGVTSSKIVTNLASGINDVKKQVSQAKVENKLFSAEEVEKMISDALSKKMDNDDKSIIKTIRNKNGLL